MILRITRAEVCGEHLMRLEFNDGVSKIVNVQPSLEGLIFEPLTDPVI